MTPEEHIARLEEPQRADIQALHELIRETAPHLTPEAGERIIGYGPYHYRYASGREGDSHLIGLAANKRYISLYVQCAPGGAYLAEAYADRLPKASIGKACVRFKRLADVDEAALRELVSEAARIGPPA